ncbi:MAG: hypothetical protein S4CHLAM102_01430 [Chlamydiia bacterium]|nr:hypothetical protein [Chlamydiia bacterium]
MDTKHQELLESKIAALETQVDHMASELSHLDAMLIECGFPGGISTLKETVEELVKEGESMASAEMANESFESFDEFDGFSDGVMSD